MASQSITVSLKRKELVRLRDLYGAAWGRHESAYLKLDRAILRLDEREAQEDNAGKV